MKKFVLSLFCFSSVLVLAGCALLDKNDSTYSTLEKISVRLPIPIVDGAFAPLYIAQDKGFFEKYGLEVVLEPGSPELNPIRMVDQKIDEIGIAGGPELFLSGRDKGAKIKAFSLLHKDSNFSTLLVKNESSIQSISDLEGKDVGFFYGHVSTDILRSLFSKEGVTVNEVDVGFNYQQFIADKIDAVWAFTTTAGVNLPAKGVSVRELSPADYGIITSGYTFFAHESFLETDADVIENFWLAVTEAVEYSFENREESLVSVLSRDSSLSAKIIEEQLNLYEKGIKNNVSIGYMDRSVFVEAYNRLEEQEIVSGVFDFNEIIFDGS